MVNTLVLEFHVRNQAPLYCLLSVENSIGRGNTTHSLNSTAGVIQPNDRFGLSCVGIDYNLERLLWVNLSHLFNATGRHWMGSSLLINTQNYYCESEHWS
jgi:hypothetical protein